MELRDGRCGYKSEISDETRRLWEDVEANRRAFMREVPEDRRERLWSSVNRPNAADLEGLSPKAAAHARFCWAVSAAPTKEG